MVCMYSAFRCHALACLRILQRRIKMSGNGACTRVTGFWVSIGTDVHSGKPLTFVSFYAIVA